MINELYFAVHSIVLTFASIGALSLGKEGLITFIALQTILANFFATKQITLFGFNATAAEPFIIGSALSLNLLQEYYSLPDSRKAIKVTFLMLISYGIFSYLHLSYMPSPYDFTNPHFKALLVYTPRIISASLLVYWISSHLHIALYAFLKNRFASVSASIRNGACLSITQLVDTVLFTFLGFWGILSNLTEIIAISYIIKLSCIIIATPGLTLAKKIIPYVNNE